MPEKTVEITLKLSFSDAKQVLETLLGLVSDPMPKPIEPEKKKRGRKTKTAPTEEPKTATIEEVRKAVREALQREGTEFVKSVLEKHGAAKIQDLKESDYESVIIALAN